MQKIESLFHFSNNKTHKTLNDMAKILGLDLGTDSIGWAIRNTDISDGNPITHYGTTIFSKGVGMNKSGEFSLAAERTRTRNMRKAYRRRKQRKGDLLKILTRKEIGMCPLSNAALADWVKYQKGHSASYPDEKEFRDWVKMNPLEARAKSVSNQKVSKLEVGRALYHLCQRRGFKSNRLDISEKNLPKDEILTRNFREDFGDKTIGEVMWEKTQNGEKVRNDLRLSRHLNELEFDLICKKQKIDSNLTKELKEAIFFQRPLKSQRHTVGKCTLESGKPRCPMSAPIFEKFRAYQFLNSIFYRLENEPSSSMQVLSEEHKELVLPKFFRKSNFKFGEIKKAIEKKEKCAYHFNYKEDRTISGSPTISAMNTHLGKDWETEFKRSYEVLTKNGETKTRTVNADDIWHVWYSFTEDTHLRRYALEKLKFDEVAAEKFSRVQLVQGFSKLSKMAIGKILHQLKNGLQYSHAVFLANMETVLGKELWEKEGDYISEELHKLIENHSKVVAKNHIINALIEQFKRLTNNSWIDYTLDDKDWENVDEKIKSGFGKSTWGKIDATEKAAIREEIGTTFQQQLRQNRGTFVKNKKLEDRIKEFLQDNFDVQEEDLQRLYHPSAIDKYPKRYRNNKDEISLGSPRTSSIRNPMAMRTLYELRKVVNDLLRRELIDEDTKVIIELARDLNDANKRWAIEVWQKEQESKRNYYRKKIAEFYLKEKNIRNHQPTETQVRKYQLWEEQNEICIYTGEGINISELLESNNYDLEHTLPRSQSFDNSLANMTVCDAAFNRKIKRNQAPFELLEKNLVNKDDLFSAIEHWQKRIFGLKKRIEKLRSGSGYEAKDVKDKRIRQRHLLQLELDYWRNKYSRFTAKEYKDGFKNSQIVDTGIITKYARAYLQTVFEKVYSVKGNIVAEYRKLTGIQDRYVKKERKKHDHHTIDAIVVTCLTPETYRKMANHYQEYDEARLKKRNVAMKHIKPWKNFVEDLQDIENEILTVHHHPDNLAKQTKVKMRRHGKVQSVGGTKNPKIGQGEGVRGRLHQDTFYGAIKQFDKDGKETVKYVKRVLLADLKESDIGRIVDENIREHFKAEIKKRGLKNIVEKGIFMPKSKRKDSTDKPKVPIKKVRIEQKVKDPIRLKEQSHKAENIRREHKEFYYVQNDSNYELVVYESENKGKMKRKSLPINLMEAGEIYVRKNTELVPTILNKMPKVYHLRKHKMVLFYEESLEEISWENPRDLNKRLYRVSEISGDGRAKFKYHLEARNDDQLKTDLKEAYPEGYEKTLVTGKSKFIWQAKNPFPKLHLSPINFNFLLEGIHFTMTNLGEIKKI